MLELSLLLTGIFVLKGAYDAYRHTQDPTHPMIIFMPLLLYTYVFHPLMLTQNGAVDRFFPHRADLDLVGLLNMLGVGAFCLGTLWDRMRPGSWGLRGVEVARAYRPLLYQYALVLGGFAVGGFFYMVVYSGGFERVFFRGYKPYLQSPSGYVGELPMLSFPSLLLLALAIRGRTLQLKDAVAALVIAMPHLIMATLGGRRGAAFLSLFALAGFWHLATGRRPRISTTVLGLAVIGLLLIFLVSNRSNLYLGSQGEVDIQRFARTLFGEEADSGDEFIAGSAYVIAAHHYEEYTWGARLFALVFVRPIPRQFWPDKYSDVGMAWMEHSPGSGGFTNDQWLDLFGFVPQAGSAGGFVSDLFMEYSWGCVFVCFLLGWLYIQAWTRMHRYGGFWSICYLELLILSVYLPAQTLGAWLYRALLLIVPTWLVWRVLLNLPVSGRPAKLPAPVPRRPYRNRISHDHARPSGDG
jgi:hypothetical protein